ncbi:MAG: outer membrane protein assembly factor BamA [Rhodobacteraceae bacterium]|nr:outer membrane protein assembly factor BamA [Paracoccaceae bacterium]
MLPTFKRAVTLWNHTILSGAPVRIPQVVALSLAIGLAAPAVQAQDYRFDSVRIEGNQRIETATILTYAGIPRGQVVTAGQMNEAYQRIANTGLFESVEIVPQGGQLVIKVTEYPTINRVSFEGNRRLKDEALAELVTSTPRRVFSPAQAQQDAEAIIGAYRQAGRLAASVDPKIIRRSNNRVDLVFEITESGVASTERISFVGNRSFSDRRLRRVLESKQAGLLRAIISSDQFVAERLEFDKQVLTDFYQSRGYVDFRVLDVTSEVTRERNAFFITFNVQEGQSFDFGRLTASSTLPGVDAQEFLAVSKIDSGDTYSPTAIENTIARMERLAIKKGLNFVRVEPQITRNDAAQTLDVNFQLSRGPRIFVERIDIEGNNTTLDKVIRREFRVVEGDPFNPREIRQTAERIRALDYFEKADVSAREGSSPQQVIIDVDVEEKPTGSLSFGASYSTDSGVGLAVSFSERNFLGRGQQIGATISAGTDNQQYSFNFSEPRLLDRDLRFSFNATYVETERANSDFDTTLARIQPSIEFPISEETRLELRYILKEDRIYNVSPDSSDILHKEAGSVLTSAVGYTLSYDTRRIGLDPNSGILLQFSQDFAGVGGDNEYVKSVARVIGERKIAREEITLRAGIEAGALNSLSGDSRITDRFQLSSRQFRGFESYSIGPRDLNATNRDALGGNYYAVARVEAEFPVGLPEEYGITGGVFMDVGSVWGLDNTNGGPQGAPIANSVDDEAHLRASVGVSVFWRTVIGPLRFNFSRPIQKESYDKTQFFDFTISTEF